MDVHKKNLNSALIPAATTYGRHEGGCARHRGWVRWNLRGVVSRCARGFIRSTDNLFDALCVRADGAEPGPECEVLCDVILEGAMSRCDPRVGEEWVQAHSPSRPAPVYDRVASDLHAGAGFPPAPMLPLQTPHAGMPLHTLAPTQTPPPLPYLFTPTQHVTY